ncbi:hypothetical protein T190115A13A_10160 [Tenacibaculum sp. 190524A02b]|uniref:Bacteriocin n=1 Tax=Tenacibaculum vairaonense TaxID=3137860 RepID=A0ABP1FCB6_9FLAO
MKNLENLGVISLNADEQVDIDGGNRIAEGIGYGVGISVAVFFKTLKVISQNLGSFSA